MKARYLWGALAIVLLLLSLPLLFLMFGFKSRPWDTFRGPVRFTAEDVAALSSALRLYEIDTGVYPTPDQGFQALVSIQNPPEGWGKQLLEVPLDAWGHPYQYRYPGVQNPDHFDVFSWGPDGVESEDDIGNW